MGEIIRIADARAPCRDASEVLWLAFVAAKRRADELQSINAYRAAVEAFDRWKDASVGAE